jgi:leucyl aminopeptidase
MGCFYEVGKGAEIEPRYMAVHYKGNPQSEEIDVALVGKGLTYDTGGLNIKKSTMEEMHLDKGGACAVMGALVGTLDLAIPRNIVFVLGFAENAIGAKVYKPGDIVTSLKGLTVEVGNTDAEGRLVLADSLTYTCQKYQPKTIIDIATLTGSIMVALGEETAGLFSNDEELSDQLMASGKTSDEALWKMPIMNEHREGVKRDVADLNNCGKSRYADASSAAAFLERFLEKNKESGEVPKWAHLDIAGTCIAKKQCTGFGAHLLLQYLN